MAGRIRHSAVPAGIWFVPEHRCAQSGLRHFSQIVRIRKCGGDLAGNVGQECPTYTVLKAGQVSRPVLIRNGFWSGRDWSPALRSSCLLYHVLQCLIFEPAAWSH